MTRLSEAPALNPRSDRCQCEAWHPMERRLRCTHDEGHRGDHRNGSRTWVNEAPSETLKARQELAGIAAAQRFLGRPLRADEELVHVVIDAVQAVR